MSGLPSRLVVVVAVSVAAAGTVAGCGQGFDREAAIESFQTAHPDVTDAQADCVVDGLIDRYGLDGLAAELDSGADGVGGDDGTATQGAQSPAFVEAQFREMFACGVEGDVATELSEQLVANGVPPEQAPCVSEELTGDLTDADIDVLLSGNITDAFMAKFVAAMEACGAVNTGS